MPPAPLFNRRQFLKSSAALTAGTLAFPAILRAQAAGSGPSPAPPAPRLRRRWRQGRRPRPRPARPTLHRLLRRRRRPRRQGLQGDPGVPRFKDYRVMLDKLAGQIDGVIISTPDGSHTPITLACMARGLHVYVEKPLAGTIAECRQLAAAAQQTRASSPRWASKATASPACASSRNGSTPGPSVASKKFISGPTAR